MSEPVTIEDIYQLCRTSAEEFDRRTYNKNRLLPTAEELPITNPSGNITMLWKYIAV